MIRGGFLSEEDRKALIALARDGLAAGRVTRRATALVRLDEGLSCQEVAKVLLFDDDTIRDWYELFEQDGVEGLTRFEMGGSSGKMSAEQCDALKAWVGSTLPRSTRQVGAWIAKEFGLVYESRSRLIALLHRLRLEYHKPEVISRKLDHRRSRRDRHVGLACPRGQERRDLWLGTLGRREGDRRGRIAWTRRRGARPIRSLLSPP